MLETLNGLLTDYGDKGLAYVLWALGAAALWAIARLHLARAVREALDLLGTYAANAVKQTFQTYVAAIKAGRADGVLTREEQAEAFNRARDAFLAQLNWRQILKLGGGLLLRLLAPSKWRDKLEIAVAGFIESNVANAKLAGKMAGGGTPTLTATTTPDGTATATATGAPPSPL